MDTPFEDNFESVTVEMTFKGVRFLVSEIYRPPNSNDLKFMENLDVVLSLGRKFKFSYVCGDFNYDLIKTHLHKQTEHFQSTMLDSGFAPYILKPTRVTHVSNSLIDNIFVRSNNSLSRSLSYVIMDGMSDHYPCLLSYQMFKNCDRGPLIVKEKRKITEEVLKNIQHDLLFYDWSNIFQKSVNDSYEFLLNAITTVLDRHASVKLVKYYADEKFREPWLTVGLKKSAQKCRRLCKRANQSRLDKDFVYYKKYRNALNRARSCQKKSHYSELFKKIGKNTKLLWNVIHGLVKKSNNKSDIVELLYEDELLKEPRSICDAFNQHFTTAGVRVQSTIPPANTDLDPLSYVKLVNDCFKFKTCLRAPCM